MASMELEKAEAKQFVYVILALCWEELVTAVGQMTPTQQHNMTKAKFDPGLNSSLSTEDLLIFEAHEVKH